MPLGTVHEETGLVVESRGRLYLRTPEGGHWELEASRKVRALLGLRVRLEGVRVSFDGLSVASIERI